MKLHLGCGPHYIEGMFNVDLRQDCRTDYCGSLFDLMIPEGSVELIWSCHMLEHLKYPDEVIRCLELCYSWLVEGGIIRLAVPDLELVANYYLNRDSNLFKMYGNAIDEHLYMKNSGAEVFSYFLRGWDHTIVFDFDLLSDLLSDARFKNIEKMPFRQSKIGAFPHDRLEMESMFVEAEK